MDEDLIRQKISRMLWGNIGEGPLGTEEEEKQSADIWFDLRKKRMLKEEPTLSDREIAEKINEFNQVTKKNEAEHNRPEFRPWYLNMISRSLREIEVLNYAGKKNTCGLGGVIWVKAWRKGARDYYFVNRNKFKLILPEDIENDALFGERYSNQFIRNLRAKLIQKILERNGSKLRLGVRKIKEMINKTLDIL